MVFRNHYNNNEHVVPTDYEHINMPSQTIPDQSMSVKELIQRHTSGLGWTGVKVPVYNGDEELPDWNKLDLSEQHEMLQAAKLQTQEIKLRLWENEQRKKYQTTITLVPPKTENPPALSAGEKQEP